MKRSIGHGRHKLFRLPGFSDKKDAIEFGRVEILDKTEVCVAGQSTMIYIKSLTRLCG